MKGFTIGVSLVVGLLYSSPATADHSTTANTVDELEDELAVKLVDIHNDYGNWIPLLGPDPTKFERLLLSSREKLERAMEQLNDDQVCKAARNLWRSIVKLDKATQYKIDQNESGSGFSDDIAIRSTSALEFFLHDLIVLAATGENASDSADDLPDKVLLKASQDKQEGDDLRSVATDGDSAPAAEKYKRGICRIYNSMM